MEQTENVFTAKTVDEAIAEGLATLGITLDEAEITVIEEGKKKLFGSVKAQVKVEKKRSEGKRAADFIDNLLAILGIKAVSEVVSEDEAINIDIKTTASSRVIGKRGDVLDAIQCMAGAYANIGSESYKKVVVDCENYRAQREQTLKELALKLAAKAVESGRKMSLEPMTPYERRIIHSVLMDNADVKTVSEGKEPARYIVVIPNNAKPGDKGIRYGERHGGRGNGRRDNRGGGRRDNRGERRSDNRGERRSSGGAKRGKKEIHFGAFLGNSNDLKPEETKTEE
ncbi:MAG: protein jag [Clostridia bacterium]|nr:protein jag [Clostridia bacterium]